MSRNARAQTLLPSSITILFKDLIRLNSLKSQVRCESDATSETLSMGILDQLGLSASTESASQPFDDSERRRRAQNAAPRRDLENNFDFLIDPQDKLTLEES